jgi:ribose 5-phosphate isomerase RpiB
MHSHLTHSLVSRAVAIAPEHDDMNVFCLLGNVTRASLAWELLQGFLRADFSVAPRHRRRAAKVLALEKQRVVP